jgi:plasmid stabilization system protein ParE
MRRWGRRLGRFFDKSTEFPRPRLLEGKLRRGSRASVAPKNSMPPVVTHNIRVLRCRRHYIFVLTEAPPIILAFLHERMDFETRLRARL